MKSTEGKHFVGLDQIRGIAAFLVFVWHARGQSANGGWAPLTGTDSFIGFSLFAEGHTGVAIFMVLSGYLFVKLIGDRKLLLWPFLYNRFMRLAPLMGLVIAIWLVITAVLGPAAFARQLNDTVRGLLLPTWPNGGWSITIESQFYLVFPVLLFISRRRPWLLVAILLAMIAFRYGVYELLGSSVRRVAYMTIVGRIDQFLVGMTFAHYAGALARQHIIALVVAAFWSYFYSGGGFERNEQFWLWVFIPSFEALAYGTLIAYYDQTFRPSTAGISGALAKVGEWSFSIYLLHQFFIGYMIGWIEGHLIRLDNIYLLLLASIPCFAVTCMVAWLVYEKFEKRFLCRRKTYLAAQGGSFY